MAKGGSPRLTACVGLCALPRGRVRFLSHLGFRTDLSRFRAVLRGLNRRKDEEQEKALTLLCVRAGTTSRSASGFRGSELMLFPRSKGELDADIGKSPRIRRFDRVGGDAVLRKEKFWEMKEEKNRHTVWLTDNAWELVEERYQKDNCSTKNEYIEKAIRFYSGYLDSERAEEYLPRVLADVLEGKLGALGKRMGHLIFKLAVEENLMGNLLAAGMEVDLDTLRKTRVRCVREVKETNGEIDLEDALSYQKGVEL